MSKTPITVKVVNGKDIISSTGLPVQNKGVPTKITAMKGQKFLLTDGQDGPAPEKITVKRVGDDLQVFSEEGAQQPDLIIQDFFTQQGELSGMAQDGTYHVYASAADGNAFAMMEDGATSTLLMSNTATAGLSAAGLASGGLLAGMSAGMIAAGAALAAAAVAGVAVAASNNGKDHHEDKGPNTPKDLTVKDGNGRDLSNGGDFNTNPLVFAGSGKPGDTAIVYDNGNPIASVVVGEDGQWSIPITLPEDGKHDLSVGFKDPSGKESGRTDPISVGFDETPPEMPDNVTITDGNGQDISAGGDTRVNPINFGGTGNAGDTVIVYDGDKPIASTIVGEDGNWHIPVTLEDDGKHDLSVGFEDAAGNKGERTDPVDVGFYDEAPKAPNPDNITITDGNGQDLSQGGDTKVNPINFGGTGGRPGDIAIVYDGDKAVGSTTVDENGNWNIPVVVGEDGKHDLSVGFEDPLGQKGGTTDPVDVGFYENPPKQPDSSSLVITDGNGNDLAGGGKTNANPITFEGIGREGDTVIVYDGTTPVGSTVIGEDGKWSIPVTLPNDADYDLSVGFTDPLNQSGPGTTPVDVGYSTKLPGEPVGITIEDTNGKDLTNGGGTNVNPVTFKGEANEGDIVIIRDGDGKELGSTVVDNTGKWTLPVTLPTTGDVEASVVIKDEYGNESKPSPSVELGFSTAKPADPVDVSIVDANGKTLSAGGATNTNPLTFSGKGVEGDIVLIYNGAGAVFQSTLVDSSGNWSMDVTFTTEAKYDLKVGFDNKYGNKSGTTSTVSIDYDITPPVAPTNVVITDANGNIISGGGYTNKNPLSFSGTGIHGDIAYIVDSKGVTLGSGVVDEHGNWTASINLPVGDVDVAINFKDQANNVGPATTTVNVGFNDVYTGSTATLDNLNPTLSGAAGSVAAGSEVVIYDGAVVIDRVNANADGSWTWTPKTRPSTGDHEYSAEGHDKYGNSQTSKPVSITMTNTDWVFKANDGDGWVRNGSYVNDGTFSANGTFSSSTNGSTNGGASWATDVISKTINLINGHTYTFNYTSWAGVLINTAALGVKLDGVIILISETLTATQEVYTVTFEATKDGPAILSIFNDTSGEVGNDLYIRDLNLIEKNLNAPIVTSSILNVEIDDFVHAGHELILNQEEAVLNLTKAVEQLQDINTVSLNGHGANTLNVSINDVLALGKEDLFIKDGSKQLMINGDKEDTVNLQSIAGDKGIENWNSQGEVTVGGAVYNLYQSDSQEVELLIQQGIQIQQH